MSSSSVSDNSDQARSALSYAFRWDSSLASQTASSCSSLSIRPSTRRAINNAAASRGLSLPSVSVVTASRTTAFLHFEREIRNCLDHVLFDGADRDPQLPGNFLVFAPFQPAQGEYGTRA